MAIVHQLNKKTGVTYVYESYSYRDKTTKQPRAKRKLIGRLASETGEIVPTRKRSADVTTSGRKDVDTTAAEASPSASSTLAMLKEKDQTIRELRAEINRLKREREQLASELHAISEKPMR